MTDRYILSYFNGIGWKVDWFEDNIIIAANSCINKWLLTSRRKQSLRAVLRTLIKIYTFAPNFKFGTK